MARHSEANGASRIAGGNRLSKIVLGALAAVLVGLWVLYASLTISERWRGTLRAAHNHLGATSPPLTAPEHASTMMEMGIPIRIKGMPGRPVGVRLSRARRDIDRAVPRRTRSAGHLDLDLQGWPRSASRTDPAIRGAGRSGIPATMEKEISADRAAAAAPATR